MKVYLLCGKARCGKGTASTFIKEELEKNNHKVCEIQIMRAVKGYARDYFGWNGNEETKPRKLLQEMGYDLIRKKLNLEDFHINRLCEDITILSNYFDTFIVNDIRFPNEIDKIKDRLDNVVSIGIIKENYISPLDNIEEAHITEHALDDYNNYDYKVINKDINSLKVEIDSILRKEVD